MPNRQIAWPVGQDAARNVYAAEADAQFALITGVPNDIFTYRRTDALGQPYCAYLGPPFVYSGNVVEEPPSCAALRGEGVIVDAVVLPED